MLADRGGVALGRFGVRHVHHLVTLAGEEPDGDVVERAVAGGRHLELAGIGLGVVQHVLERHERTVIGDEEHRRRQLNDADVGEVLDLQTPDPGGPVGDRDAGDGADGVAVGLAVLHLGQPGVAGRAGHVRNRNRDAQVRLQESADGAAHSIRPASRSEIDDQLHRTGGKALLGMNRTRHRRRRQSGQGHRNATNRGHVEKCGYCSLVPPPLTCGEYSVGRQCMDVSVRRLMLRTASFGCAFPAVASRTPHLPRPERATGPEGRIRRFHPDQPFRLRGRRSGCGRKTCSWFPHRSPGTCRGSA